MEPINIPPEHHTLINQAVHAAFPAATWLPTASLGGGLSTSALYKIALGPDDYVARVSGVADRHNNLAQEYAALRIAAERAIAPRLYYADPQTGVMLMDFMPSQSLFRPRDTEPSLAWMLAQLVRTLHQGPAFFQGDSLFVKTETIFRWLPPPLQEMHLLRQAITLKRTLETRLTDPGDLRPCHCDINPGNLLFDGTRLWLVDWATAGQENFYFDLATCTNFFFFRSAEAEQAFLEAYFGHPLTAGEAEKYAQMRIFCAIYYGLIFLYNSSLRSTMRLSDEEIAALPDYPHFMARIGAGQEHLEDPSSQQKLGFIYLQSAFAMNRPLALNE